MNIETAKIIFYDGSDIIHESDIVVREKDIDNFKINFKIIMIYPDDFVNEIQCKYSYMEIIYNEKKYHTLFIKDLYQHKDMISMELSNLEG